MALSFIQNMGGGIILVLWFFSLLYIILWIYCLVDIVRSEYKDPSMKLVWLLIILFAQVIGPIVYLIMGKGTKTNYT
ncbi:PLD nuclease N-terminal domain-containing protein [Algoriphagus sp.]|uniref:PLD nuclease N-terminal domain-containing protein n=1 Tax=Algoriphagus sp. TaxID=1872435 RepID=UPI0025EF59AF|nr:PLD nuclease N-terminal domain-containing protein [Algoriphagus sp.]